MLKFLEVKLVFIVTPVNFKGAKEKDLANKYCKAPSCSILTQNVNFQENATSNFHETIKNKYFELIYIYLDTKFVQLAIKGLI